MSRPTTKRVNSEKKPGLHGDDGGLYLRIASTGSKSWILRTVVHGHRRDLGIGSASLVGSAEARDIAHRLRKVARAGGDPDTVRRRETLAFEEASRRVHENLLPTWRSARHGEIRLAALSRYAFPTLGKRPLDTIGVADVLGVLEPIWTTKFDTANRVQQRMAAIFDWGKGAGHYSHENPVNGLKKALPNVKPSRSHRAALPWRDARVYLRVEGAKRHVGTSAGIRGPNRRALRRSERCARWEEIDGDSWTVPASRMKTGKAHRVPLSKSVAVILNAVRGLDQELVFPSPVRDKSGKARPLSDTVFKALMDRMTRTGLTTHGFRSTFRDWCSESAHADREIAEAALSHTLVDTVERAYARSDLFERRRTLMSRWAEFLMPRRRPFCGSKAMTRKAERAEGANAEDQTPPLVNEVRDLSDPLGSDRSFRSTHLQRGVVRLTEFFGLPSEEEAARIMASPEFGLQVQGTNELNPDHSYGGACGVLMDADLWMLSQSKREQLVTEVRSIVSSKHWVVERGRVRPAIVERRTLGGAIGGAVRRAKPPMRKQIRCDRRKPPSARTSCACVCEGALRHAASQNVHQVNCRDPFE